MLTILYRNPQNAWVYGTTNLLGQSERYRRWRWPLQVCVNVFITPGYFYAVCLRSVNYEMAELKPLAKLTPRSTRNRKWKTIKWNNFSTLRSVFRQIQGETVSKVGLCKKWQCFASCIHFQNGAAAQTEVIKFISGCKIDRVTRNSKCCFDIFDRRSVLSTHRNISVM